MPNWASSHITIRGKTDDIVAIKEQLSTPYDSPWNGEPDYKDEPKPNETITGDFLLWNIVKPTNLHAYLGKEEKEFEAIIKSDPALREIDLAQKQADWKNGNAIAQILHDQATKDDWYNWNVRNWGTKWETSDDGSGIMAFEPCLDDTTCMRIVYAVSSAWSPPIEALHKLAEQYPEVTIHISSIDEGDCFALTADWDNGHFNEVEVEITHDFGMALRGYCNLECCE